jgi:hypothetical protein
MMKKVIVLNHFRGYPELMDECSNNNRYAQLQFLIDHVYGKASDVVFLWNDSINIDTPKEDKKMMAIKDISQTNFSHRWVSFFDSHNLDAILLKVAQGEEEDVAGNPHIGFNITPHNSHIIITGTNTAGCLLRNANVSIKEWFDRGFTITLCLSMCADYQLDGLNPTDKNQKATAILYQYLKDNDMIHKVNICYSPQEMGEIHDRLG